MPIIIACPQCHGKLRVADELSGQRLRCPACDHTFESDEAAAPPPTLNSNPAPLEPRDLPLRLTLDEADAPPSADGKRDLVGAVEVTRPLDEVSPTPPGEAPVPNPRPLLNDAHEELKQCPECGVHVHRDSTRCYHCGERFGKGRRDWEGPDIRRRARRDAEPDRGVMVLVLGILSLASLMVWCFPIGVVLGLVSWIMGHTDLRKMKRGTMDDNGRPMTQAGWICGLIGTSLNGLLMLGCLTLFGFGWYESMTRPPLTKPMMATRAVPAPMQKGQPQPKKQLLK